MRLRNLLGVSLRFVLLLSQLLVPLSEPIQFLLQGLHLLQFVLGLVLFVHPGHYVVVNVVDLKLDLLHPEHTLNRWLRVKRQIDVYNLHTVINCFL